jgi:hypothetical protein
MLTGSSSPRRRPRRPLSHRLHLFAARALVAATSHRPPPTPQAPAPASSRRPPAHPAPGRGQRPPPAPQAPVLAFSHQPPPPPQASAPTSSHGPLAPPALDLGLIVPAAGSSPAAKREKKRGPSNTMCSGGKGPGGYGRFGGRNGGTDEHNIFFQLISGPDGYRRVGSFQLIVGPDGYRRVGKQT